MSYILIFSNFEFTITIFELVNIFIHSFILDTQIRSLLLLFPGRLYIVAPTILLLLFTEGEGYLCSLVNKTIISQYHFTQPVHAAKFSPDAR